MGRKAELVDAYTTALKTRCGLDADRGLVAAITDSCGPSVFTGTGAKVHPDRPDDLKQVRENFLVRKLDGRDGPDLADAILAAVETYGPTGPGEGIPRPVLYYLLTVQLGRQSYFKDD